MFGLITRKQAEKEFNKISQGFKDIKKDIVSKDKIDLMIREAFDRERIKLHEQTPRTPQTKRRTKVNKILDRAEIMQEIASLEQKGLTTGEIYNIIVDEKQLIKKTCFFKYMKIIRENSARTPRTEQQN